MEEVVCDGVRRGGHGLEVGPGSLFHEAVADGYLAPRRSGGGGGVGGGSAAGDEVLEGCVGDGLDRKGIEISVAG